MNLSGWSFSVRPYAWLWLFLIFAAGLLAWYSYRRTIPPIGERWRRALLGGRLGALALLALAALAPRFEWHGLRERPPRATVLVDQSESLSFADAYGSRPEAVKRVLSGPGMARIRREAEVSWQGFAERVWSLDPDALSFSGKVTAIGDALLEQRRRIPSPDLVILISDGANTTGPDPVRAASEIGLPVYAIGIGAPYPQPDVRIVGVAAPQIALAGHTMSLTVTIENIGLPPRTSAVRVVHRGGTLARREIRLPPTGGRADVELRIAPAEPGIFRAAVVVDSIPGELFAGNNRWPFTTQVLKATHRALILAGAPSPDVAFWMRFFRRREDFSARLWLAPHPSRPAEPPPLAPDSLAEVDLIIWHDMPPRALTDAQLDAVAEAVRKGAGLLVIPGYSSLPARWEAILPVQPGSGRFVVQQTQVLWTPEARRHPIASEDPEFENWSLRWDVLPPLLGRTAGLMPTSSGAVLLVGEGEPLAIAGTSGRGRVLVFGGLTYWRWDMVPRGLGEERSPANEFWNAVVRWLGTRRELNRVRIQSDAPLYRLGEPVRLIVRVYDERYAPLDGADVRVEIDQGAYFLVAAAQGEGRYVAEVVGLGPGEHRAVARATVGGTPWGNASAEFSVATVGREHEQTRQQREVLEAIARAAGGAYAPAAKADSLLAVLPLAPVEESYERSIAVGLSGWVLWGIIGLLTVEWIARRVHGLL